MAIAVQIPTALRRFVGGADTLQLEGATAGQVLAAMAADHPDLKKHLFNTDGALRNFVNVYINDEDIRHLRQLDTPTRDGDVITIVPAVAGGRARG